MHSLLIHLSVIMILNYVCCSDVDDIKDLSDWCSSGQNIYYYLTSGVGSSDKSVTTITSKKKRNCTLKFSVKAGSNLMVMLEFPDMKPNERICFTEQNTSVLLRDYNENESCKNRGRNYGFYKVAQGNISVQVRSAGEMSTVKIIATSMRDGERKRCSNNEVECVVAEKRFCMIDETLCDRHNNSIMAAFTNEDGQKYKDHKLSFFVILCTLGMVLMTFFLIISVAMALVPKRKETYVHSFDETMSAFDVENGIISVEVNIEVLFPPKRIYYPDNVESRR